MQAKSGVSSPGQVLGNSRRKNLEEQFYQLKLSLAATCDYALATLEQVERENTASPSQSPNHIEESEQYVSHAGRSYTKTSTLSQDTLPVNPDTVPASTRTVHSVHSVVSPMPVFKAPDVPAIINGIGMLTPPSMTNVEVVQPDYESLKTSTTQSSLQALQSHQPHPENRHLKSSESHLSHVRRHSPPGYASIKTSVASSRPWASAHDTGKHSFKSVLTGGELDPIESQNTIGTDGRKFNYASRYKHSYPDEDCRSNHTLVDRIRSIGFPWKHSAKETRTGFKGGSNSNHGMNACLKMMPKKVFADAEAMKDRVRSAMRGPRFNVTQMYKTTGIAQRIARSTMFDNLTLVVIALNSLWIGIEAEFNEEAVLLNAAWQYQVAENIFCVYFFSECTIRFAAFKKKLDVLRDGSFCFDASLAFLMVLETWVMTVVFLLAGGSRGSSLYGDASILRLIRLLRLSRMARVLRLLKAMPEIMILIKGMSVAMRSVFFTLILLLVVMYIFAVAFVQLTSDSRVGSEYFSGVISAMKTLLLSGTLLENIPDVYYMCADESELLGLLLLIYVLIGSLTVMNMLVGVLVEVVSVVASVEKETLETTYVKEYLETLFRDSGMDVNSDNMISKEEFETLLEHPGATRCLHSVGVDVVGLVDYADFIFRGEDLCFVDFVELVLSLRGSNVARVKDIVDLRTYMTLELDFKFQVREQIQKEKLDRIEAYVLYCASLKAGPSDKKDKVDAATVLSACSSRRGSHDEGFAAHGGLPHIPHMPVDGASFQGVSHLTSLPHHLELPPGSLLQ